MTPTTFVAVSIVFAFLLTMPVFALVGRGRPVDADVARRPTTLLLGVWVRDWLMWVVAPVERALVRTGASPDLLNYLGGAFGLAAGVAYANGTIALGGAFVLLGGLADVLDGRVARARGLGSDYGEFLDSIIDRFSEMFAYMGLALYFEPSRWAMLSTVVALGGAMMVSYSRAKGAAVGVDCKGGIMQRAERLVLLALASLLDNPICDYFGWPQSSVLISAVTVIGAASVGTAVYRSVVIVRELRARIDKGITPRGSGEASE
jgi:phosphatidylglycerophosphate synthase